LVSTVLAYAGLGKNTVVPIEKDTPIMSKACREDVDGNEALKILHTGENFEILSSKYSKEYEFYEVEQGKVKLDLSLYEGEVVEWNKG